MKRHLSRQLKLPLSKDIKGIELWRFSKFWMLPGHRFFGPSRQTLAHGWGLRVEKMLMVEIRRSFSVEVVDSRTLVQWGGCRRCPWLREAKTWLRSEDEGRSPPGSEQGHCRSCAKVCIWIWIRCLRGVGAGYREVGEHTGEQDVVGKGAPPTKRGSCLGFFFLCFTLREERRHYLWPCSFGSCPWAQLAFGSRLQVNWNTVLEVTVWCLVLPSSK